MSLGLGRHPAPLAQPYSLGGLSFGWTRAQAGATSGAVGTGGPRGRQRGVENIAGPGGGVGWGPWSVPALTRPDTLLEKAEGSWICHALDRDLGPFLFND